MLLGFEKPARIVSYATCWLWVNRVLQYASAFVIAALPPGVLVGVGVNSRHLAVNGEEIAVRMFPPYRVELSPYLKAGKNTLTLTVINNLRNMQGPLHRGAEIHIAAPDSFYRESNVFRPKPNAGESCHDVFDDYYDDYCLVKFGLK